MLSLIRQKCLKFFFQYFRCLPFILFLCPYAGAQEQVNLSPLDHFSSLSQNSIYSCFKDKFGLMWFGTQDGLNKYDGYKVTVYRHHLGQQHTLPGNFITAISDDPNGDLWVGTRLSGLSRYKRDKEEFFNFSHDAKNAGSICSNSINCIYKDRHSKMWIGTAGGLNSWDPKAAHFKKYNYEQGNSQSLSDDDVVCIFEDAANDLWVGTANGLNRLDRKKGTFTRYLDSPKSNKLADNRINVIFEDGRHRLWMGTSKGLKMLNKTTGRFEYLAVAPDHYSIDSINPVFCVAPQQQNRYWIGTNTTLQLFDAGAGKMIAVSDKNKEDDMMPNDGIYSLLTDNAGILWIGTTSQGVIKHDRNLPYFPAFKNSRSSMASATNIVRSIAEDTIGNLYLATDAGLEYLDRKTGRYTKILHRKSDPQSLSSNYTTAVLVSKRSGDVWVGTYNSGLNRKQGGHGFRRYTQGGTGQLQSNSIDVLLEDRSGKIWIGTNQGGLSVFDPSTGKFSTYQHLQGDPTSICDNIIMALMEDRRGRIWIGGYSNGISILDPETGSCTQLNTSNSALSSDVITSFYQDVKGNVWVGTMEGGLNFYKNGSFSKDYNQRLHDVIPNAINFITSDDLGYLWLSTNQGLLRLDTKKLTVRAFGYFNGLKTLEFNQGSGIRLNNGSLAFGSINGFHIVDPADIHFNPYSPPVVFTGFDLFKKSPGTADASPFGKSMLISKTVELGHDQPVFTIRYAALNYTSSAMNRYAYKLEGFDKSWNQVSEQREATYTNLNPGTYRFRVIAANNDGVWNNTGASLIIVIRTPFWMTWWFRLISALSIAALMYLAYRYRIKFFEAQRKELQKKVDKRTKRLRLQSEELMAKSSDLEKLNTQLKAQKEEEQKAREDADKANKAKTIFLAVMSHEIRTPMNGVIGMAELLAGTRLDQEQQEYTHGILHSGKALLSVINDVLDFSKIESGQMELDTQEFKLQNCIEEALKIFPIDNTAVNLSYHIDEDVPAHLQTDCLRLQQILINLVGNAIKFTEKGSITLTVSVARFTGDQFELQFQVEDTGIGMPTEKLGHLFSPFQQLDSSTTRKYGGSGLGLAICDRLIKLLGGHIEVQSKEGEGSCFTFFIRCKTAKLPMNELGKPSLLESGLEAGSAGSFAQQYPLAILVAEDNLMNQKVIMRLLAKFGYSPDLAGDGQQALEMLENKTCDLVLMDIQMPNLDGLEATKRIRQIFGQRPLIVGLTANAFAEDKQACLEAGMNDYISKPIDVKLLQATLKAMYTKNAES